MEDEKTEEESSFFLQVASQNNQNIKKERQDSIVVYFSKFLLEKSVPSDDRKAMVASFVELGPSDLQDAMYCANIVYSQQLISELNQYRNMYKKYEITSNSASKKYKWAFEQYRQAIRTLDDLIVSRARYRNN